MCIRDSDKITLQIQELNIKINLVSDIVSDNFRVYTGIYDGLPVNLETHCTIVRVSNSPDDVYFGHVTLIITYSNKELGEYKWHYGVKTINDLPSALKNQFWQPNKNPQNFAETTKVSFFGDFKHIQKQISLSDMMKSHFKDCINFFYEKKDWPPNQIWNTKSQVNGQKAFLYFDQLRTRLQKLERLQDMQSHIDAIKKQIINNERERKQLALLEEEKKRDEE